MTEEMAEEIGKIAVQDDFVGGHLLRITSSFSMLGRNIRFCNNAILHDELLLFHVPPIMRHDKVRAVKLAGRENRS